MNLFERLKYAISWNMKSKIILQTWYIEGTELLECLVQIMTGLVFLLLLPLFILIWIFVPITLFVQAVYTAIFHKEKLENLQKLVKRQEENDI